MWWTRIVALIALLPAAALAGTSYDRAEVVAVEPLYETLSYEVPREQCHVQRTAYPAYRHTPRRSATGPVLGAIIGGAIGNAVGHGKRNKQVGTAVGAILGGTIGADIARSKRRHYDTYDVYGEYRYRDEEVCRTISDVHTEERIAGYRVTYRYGGATYTTTMDRDPGASLPVRVQVTPAV